MPSRIGITTNPARQRAYWERQSTNLQNWQVAGPFHTKRAAESYKDQQAALLNCSASPDGLGPEVARWYVYYFDHDGGC